MGALSGTAPKPWPARLGGLAAGGLVLALVGMALGRRLNFDEPLALRAGGLALEGVDARPGFVMPWTLLLGALGRAIDDPGAVILACRLASLGAVGGGMALALRASSLGRGAGALALLLTLCQASFLVHGLEFRYDAAVLAGLLLGLAATLSPSPRAELWLGLCAGGLALHHLKGAFFAAALLGVAWWARGRRLSLGRVGLGVGIVALLWLGVLALTGLGGAWVRSQAEFVALAGSGRANPLDALGWVFRRDAGWWLAVAVGVGLSWRSGPREQADRALLGLGLVTAGFPLLHPHPWSYMLALPAPFFAMLLARAASRLPEGRARWLALGGGLAALGVQALTGGAPIGQLQRGLRQTDQDAVAVMRLARRRLPAEAEVLDPSGLLWFARPCVRDWYQDTLFAEGLADGSWAPELREGLPEACAVVVDTYRLNMLPDAAKAAIEADTQPLGPLRLRAGDPLLQDAELAAGLSGRSLESYK